MLQPACKKGKQNALTCRGRAGFTSRMPQTQATGAVEAADAVETNPQPDGATPPQAAATADSMSNDQAREILRGAGRTPLRESDPLSDEDGSDPLTNEGLTIEQVLGYEPETAADPVEDQQEEQAETTTETAEAATEEAPATEEQEQPPVKTEADGRKRVNIFRKNADGTFVHSDLTRRAMIMADEHGIDLIDALKTLGAGDKLSEKPAEAAPAKKEPTPAEIDAQIKDLREKRKEARESINDDLADKLNDEINDLVIERQNALQRDVQAQQVQRETQGTLAQKVDASAQRAVVPYPDAGKEGTALFDAVEAESERLRTINSPLLLDEDWPETVVAKIATRLGIAPAAKVAPKAAPAAPVTGKTAPKVAPKRTATPVPSPGSISAPVAKVDPRKELERQLETERDPVVLAQLMRKAVQLERAA